MPTLVTNEILAPQKIASTLFGNERWFAHKSRTIIANMATQLITLSGKTAFGKPVGKCIYCGSDGGRDGLSDEHIVAFCLGNDAFLPKASCAHCAKTTSYLEGYAGRHVFGPLRAHFKIQSRRKSIASVQVDVSFIGAKGEEIRSVDRYLLPPILCLPILKPAGVFEGSHPMPVDSVTNWHWFAEDPELRMSRLLQPGEFGWRIPTRTKPDVFARMLAKIAHTAAIAWLGIDAFEHFLPPLILGRDDNAGYLVGCAEPPTDPLPAIPYGPKTHHHTLKVMPMSSLGKRDLIAVNLRLFQHIGTPSYWVIVGRPTEQTLAALRAGKAPN